MLVLTRKRDEMITIGSDIVIRVIKTGKGSVKIGIEAPASVRVLRGEVASAQTTESLIDLDLDLDDCVEVSSVDDDSTPFEACTLDALLVQN